MEVFELNVTISLFCEALTRIFWPMLVTCQSCVDSLLPREAVKADSWLHLFPVAAPAGSSVLVQVVFVIYSASKCLLGNTGQQTEFRGSLGLGLLKQDRSSSQTTGERLRSQARLIDILTYCTFPGRGLPSGNT